MARDQSEARYDTLSGVSAVNLAKFFWKISPVGPGMNVSHVQLPRGGADQDENEFVDNSASHTVS